MAPQSTTGTEQIVNDEQNPQMHTKNTINSSFPLLKRYTHKRGKILPNIFDWLEAKRRDDDIGENYWRVHDKIYNLEEYIHRHPGGSEWLDVTRGTDITEAFESAHLVNVNYVEKTLAEFYVKDATTPRNSPYTLKENGFYKTLKRKVEPILKESGTGPSWEIRMMQDSMFVVYVALAYVAVTNNLIWLQIVAGLVGGMCVVGAHNFLHLRDNWRRYYFDIIPFSSYEWRITHGLAHHMFPNTILDYEIMLGEPFFEMLPNRERNFIQKYAAMVYTHILYGFYAPSELLKRVISVAQGKQKIQPENFIIFAEWAVCAYWCGSIVIGFRAMFIISYVGSYVLTINNNTTHHHPTSFHDGDEAREEPDFGLCQVDASKSLDDWVHNTTFVNMTTFGDHPIHHLFPTLCISKQKYVKDVVLDTLKEFSELYPYINQWEIFKGTHLQMARTKTHSVEVYKSRKY